MIILTLRKRAISIFTIFFLSVTLFSPVAKANVFIESYSELFAFINKNIVGQIKKDFCRNYILSISNGDWKDGEFRSNLGKRVCASYSAPSSSSEKINIDPLNGNTALSQKGSPSTTSVNNPKPDVYAPNTGTRGGYLNSTQVIYYTNIERKNNAGLSSLKENKTLSNIAAIRVKDMFSQQYFEHNSPTGDNASKEAVKNGYEFITIGENIALGNFDGSKGLVQAWMDSPGHRANILNKNYTEIGVYEMQGIYNGQSVWIAAQIFGKPIAGCTSPDNTLKDKINNYKISADNMLSGINKIDLELASIGSSNQDTYNLKVAERNTLVGFYNNLSSEIKTLVSQYNSEVARYNSCIQTL